MITIGEFSKIARITSRMLRHYDSIDLLKPIYTDENTGYRYYDLSQLEKVILIEKLKSYGFKLSEIFDCIDLDEAEINEKIRIKTISQYKKLNELKKIIQDMENEIFRMKGDHMNNKNYEIVIAKNEPQTVFTFKKVINIGQVGDLFDEALEVMKNKKIKRNGVCQLAYLGKEFSYENMDVEVQIEAIGNDTDIKEIPETTYLKTVHNGSYDGLKNGYDQISIWFSKNPNYKVVGPSVERYVKDVDMVSSDDELVTEILFPIEKI